MLVIVVEALIRIGKRALKTVAADRRSRRSAFVGIFFLALPFPLIVAAAALIGYLVARIAPGAARRLPAKRRRRRTPAPGRWRQFGIAVAHRAGDLVGAGRARRAGARAATMCWSRSALFFSKLAVVTFGGAYAVLAYMAQQAVETHRLADARRKWSTASASPKPRPGPLILVTQFVGFLAAFRDAAPFSPLTAGLLGAAMTTWVTFVPSMLWIFAGAPFIEELRGNRRLAGALAAITAAVVGVILNLSVWFALHVLFGKVTEQHFGPLRWYAFDPLALDLRAAVLAAIAAVLAFGLHRGLIEVIVRDGGARRRRRRYAALALARAPRFRASGAASDARAPTAQRRSRRRPATAATAPRTCAGC